MRRTWCKSIRAGVSGVGRLAALAAIAIPAAATAGQFSVMSYNVRGLPPEVIEDRHDEIEKIAPLLEDYHTPAEPYVGIDSFVGLQEVFDQDYYDILTDPGTVTYEFRTAKDNGGPANIGDGLTNLSDFEISEFTRTQWTDCFGTLLPPENGSDCGTNKGFSFSKVVLEPGVTVDVYTLHADAGQDEGSQEARRKNILQLTAAIVANSPDRPVIVLGDTNSLYTREADNLSTLLAGTGVTDVWVQLRRSGIVPEVGPAINSECPTNPGGTNCELVDKIFYRDSTQLAFAPVSYDALKTMFSDDGGELSDHTPVTVTFDYAVLTTTTTTTTTSSSSTSTSTSTTMPFDRPCGDPIAIVAKKRAKEVLAEGLRAVTAADALFVLKAAVGTRECALCTCDVDNGGTITATDALRVLKAAVGQSIPIACPPCV
jgi:hypothetical protein